MASTESIPAIQRKDHEDTGATKRFTQILYLFG
jgi:hypothetical protein